MNAEQLRQKTVSDILGIPESVARTALLGEQAKQAQATAAYYGQRPTIDVVTEMIKKVKTPEEISKLKAETDRAVAAGLLDDAQRTTLNSLLEAKKKAAELGNTKAQQEIDSMVEVLFPSVGGEEPQQLGIEGLARGPQEAFTRALVSAKDIVDAMTRKEVAGMEKPSQELAKEKFDVQKEQTAVDIETKIRENPKSPDSVARYKDYNKFSNRDLVAINDGGKVRLLQLPRVNGRQITASQVHKAAQKAGMSVEEWLVKVLKLPEAIDYLE